MKKKDKDKYINEIVEPVCIKMGFHKVVYNDIDGSSWEFVRIKEGVEQIIEILNGISLRMRFRTNIYGQRTIGTNEIWKGSTKWDECGIYPYKDNTEFKNILNFYAMLIAEKAEEVFTSISVRIIPEIMPEDYEYLEKLYVERKVTRPVKLSQLQENIQKLTDKKIEDIKYGLIDIAFDYGNWIIANYGGRWGRHHKEFGIIEVGPESVYGNVIHDIYVFWKQQLLFEELTVKNIYSNSYEEENPIPAILDEDYEYLKELSTSYKTDSQFTIEQIQERIDVLKDKDFNIIKKELLMIAFDFGNCLISNYGGRWDRIDEGYGINKIGCQKQYIDVISVVYASWKLSFKIDRGSLEEQYLLT